jgi:hypothetical protein
VPPPRRSLDHERCADKHGPFAHAANPVRRRQRAGWKAAAVVADGQHHLLVVMLEPQLDARGLGVRATFVSASCATR